MEAEVGDRIIIRSRSVGGKNREGTVVAVEGEGGGPPYRVRWDGTEDDHLIYPGSDARIYHEAVR
ncbi:MAG: DUF1918 domain-containing protein [Acidimicrobiales bacterium]|nr:DUF1918 domain-containing protein [Acidimicrobiales bacterium]